MNINGNKTFHSAPQCSHCKRCTSYGNSVRLFVLPSVCLSVCHTSLCTVYTTQHGTILLIFLSYPPDNHHCSDHVYILDWRGGGNQSSNLYWEQCLNKNEANTVWEADRQAAVLWVGSARRDCRSRATWRWWTPECSSCTWQCLQTSSQPSPDSASVNTPRFSTSTFTRCMHCAARSLPITNHFGGPRTAIGRVCVCVCVCRIAVCRW